MPDFTRPEPRIEVQEQPIWVLARVGDGDAVDSAYATPEAAELAASHGDQPWGVEVVKTTLERQTLRPVYGGPALIEALWAEMDAIMERLMTGQQAEDGGDRYRAEELAWVLAIVTNAYDPSVDRIRKETMDRWSAAQKEER